MTTEELILQINQLKTNYTNELSNSTIEAFMGLNPKNMLLEKEIDVEIFDNQHLDFYKAIGQRFVNDMQQDVLTYFMDWFYRIKLFSEEAKQHIFDSIQELAENSPAKDIILGIHRYYQKYYEGVCSILKDTDHFLLNYFVGFSYYFQEDHKNSITHFEAFINGVENNYLSDLDTLEALSLFEWSAFVNIGNSYTVIKDFDNALQYFNDTLELMPLEKAFIESNWLTQENKRVNFNLYLANFIKVLSTGANVEQYNKIVDFAKSNYPESNYFKKVPYAMAAPK